LVDIVRMYNKLIWLAAILGSMSVVRIRCRDLRPQFD